MARLKEISGDGEQIPGGGEQILGGDEQISGGGGGNMSNESRLSRERQRIGGGGIVGSSLLKFSSKSANGFHPSLVWIWFWFSLVWIWFVGLFLIVPPAGKSLSKPRSLMQPEVDED